ncbi:MAG: four helix bundle protein [Phycisphaerae bacterium]
MDSEKKQKFDLEERLISFSVRVLNIVEALPETRVGNHIAGQLVRCGTSPASNYAEAQSGESRCDFIHKMKIALKELRETRIWLLIIQRKSLISPTKKLDAILIECGELNSIFFKSIETAQRNNKNRGSNFSCSSLGCWILSVGYWILYEIQT